MITVAAVAGALGVPAGALLKAFPVDRRGRRPAARDAARRPPRQRDQAAQRARRPRCGRRGRRSSRTGSGPPATSARSAPTSRSCSTAGVAPGGYVTGANRADAHLRGVEPGRDFAVRARRHPRGRGGRHGRRRPDPHRARDRGRQHLQARHALLGAARRDLPRRGRQGARDLDGLLRARSGAHRRRRGRAVRRRARDQLAALDRAVRRRAGRARQGGHGRSARSPSGSTTSCGRPAWTCSTTTATSARARSSPTPSCSASRCG